MARAWGARRHPNPLSQTAVPSGLQRCEHRAVRCLHLYKEPIMTTPIVLIHGLWLTPRSWEGWKARVEERGHEVLVPAWPRMESEVEALRRDPSVMNGLGLAEVVDHYARIVRGLNNPPVIMGHSTGGLVTELLLDRGLGAAGVALSPVQVKGVLRLPPAQLRSVFPALRSPTNKNKTVPMTP